jgi:hypothetical protein
MNRAADALNMELAAERRQKAMERERDEKAKRAFEKPIKEKERAAQQYEQAMRIVENNRRMINEIKARGGDVSGLEDGADRMSGDVEEGKYNELITELNTVGKEIRRRYFEVLNRKG